MASKRHKKDNCVADSSSKINHCIIHNRDTSPGPLTALTQKRLSKLKEIKNLRLSEPINSPHRMPYICFQIPDEVEPNHGYHRQCYKQFTSNLKRLSSASSTATTDTYRPSRCPSDESERFIFKSDCIFCHQVGYKKVKRAGS